MAFRPIPFSAVHIDDAFWSPRIETNRTVTLVHQLKQLKETGRLANLRRAAGLEEGPFEGYRFNDSDVYKWIEAASYSLHTHPDPALEAELDAAIELIGKAQMPDGYINSYFQLTEPDGRWKYLSTAHEMYCAGHLIEAAVAHFEATGKRTLLDIACRFADYIDSIFGPDKRLGYCGHEEIELALVKLYKTTGECRYFDLAKFFIDSRGVRPSPFELEYQRDPENPNLKPYEPLLFKNGTYDGAYAQDHLPVRKQERVVGHAVRAMYLYSAMADIAAETEDEGLILALRALWLNLTDKRMYVTGGIGPSGDNEGFTDDYDLPNRTAYAETCAAIGLVFWSHRMSLLLGDGFYVDVMERALYNGVLSGVSLDGTRFFYGNPLEAGPSVNRVEWFGCACCPPNIARLLASLGGYIYAERDNCIVVNLYISSATSCPGGRLSLQSRVIEEGRASLTVNSDAEFGLYLRIPTYPGDHPAFTINGQAVETRTEHFYSVIERKWSMGDIVDVDFKTRPARIYANPLIRDDIGRVAFQFGPLIYCHEDFGNPPPVYVDATAQIEVLDGVLTVKGYRPIEHSQPYETRKHRMMGAELVLTPYSAWNNRGPCHMQVWLPHAP